MPEFAFDVHLVAALRVEAPDEATARALLFTELDCAPIKVGPFSGEVSLNEEEPITPYDPKA